MPSNMNNKLDPTFSSSISSRREVNENALGFPSVSKARTVSTSSCATNMSTESFCISLGVGPLWWFDVPTHHRTDHDRASLLTDYSRKTSVDSGGGNAFESIRSSSECSESDGSDSQHSSDVHSLYSEDDCQEMVKHILQHDNPTRITIKLHVTENKYTKWESVLNPINNILYVAMPEELPPEASKDTFISLLEFAEEKLDVDAVVLCVNKNRPDRACLLETFLIMGFQPLSRKSPMAPPATADDSENFFLIYHIED
ncbi:LOW QUALITY PROTEIN: ornithine decarboxylase antizyme [Anastrepha obliqua]|uniref:LOW QUALITY PROTEIN: ornithine decarboxylase antizyme n=1 Tax=Anastrepha obliqua TaxID=95512 RepID=UPI0024091CF2|nr:LOW QUALITY PROTEIN: ornithine decarboxylase antizyme [Anastrepha obliqua]